MIPILINIIQWIIVAIGLFIVVFSVGEQVIPCGLLELLFVIGMIVVLIIWFI